MSLTAVTLIVKVCAADVSPPPPVVPPLSCNCTVTVAADGTDALLKATGVTLPITIDYMVPKGPETQQVAEIVQAMTGEAGFAVKLRVTEFATSLNEAEAGRFQAFQIGWSGRPDPDGNSYIFHKCKAPQNVGNFCDKDVDTWLDEARLTNKTEERKAIYAKLNKILLDDLPIIYIYHRTLLIAHTTKLQGYKQMPDGLVTGYYAAHRLRIHASRTL